MTGRFHLWPFGTRGNYVSEMTFDKAGDWQIEAVIASGEETLASAVMDIEVKEETFTPIIGSTPPLTVNKTATDEAGLTEITTWPRADIDLYQITIAEGAGIRDAVCSGDVEPRVLHITDVRAAGRHRN